MYPLATFLVLVAATGIAIALYDDRRWYRFLRRKVHRAWRARAERRAFKRLMRDVLDARPAHDERDWLGHFKADMRRAMRT